MIFFREIHYTKDLSHSKSCQQFFDSVVKPILLYGADIWGFNSRVLEINMEKVHLRYLKNLLGVKLSTATIGVYGECGRFPLYIEGHISVLKYYLRVSSLPENSIVKQIFNQMHRLDSLGYNTWVSQVKRMVCKYLQIC